MTLRSSGYCKSIQRNDFFMNFHRRRSVLKLRSFLLLFRSTPMVSRIVEYRWEYMHTFRVSWLCVRDAFVWRGQSDGEKHQQALNLKYLQLRPFCSLVFTNSSAETSANKRRHLKDPFVVETLTSAVSHSIAGQQSVAFCVSYSNLVPPWALLHANGSLFPSHFTSFTNNHAQF